MTEKNTKAYKFVCLFAIMIIAVSLVLSGCSIKEDTVESFDSEEDNVDVVTDKTKNVIEETEDTLARVVPDGIYEAEKSYVYHSGEDSVNIKVTVEDNIIIDASITPVVVHDVSKKYIKGINDALPELVIGKNINELDLPDKISGASLTTPVLKQYLKDL